MGYIEAAPGGRITNPEVLAFVQGMIDKAVEGLEPGAPVATPVSNWTAADSNFSAWAYDSQLATATAVASDGTLYVEKCKAATTDAITAVRTSATGLGTGMTLCKVAVFDSAGAQIGISADASAAFAGAGGTVTLASPTRALVVGEVLYLAFLAVGGTPPTLRTSVSATGLNHGLTAANGYRSGTLTGQADMPSALTLSGLTSNTIRRWFAAQHA